MLSESFSILFYPFWCAIRYNEFVHFRFLFLSFDSFGVFFSVCFLIFANRTEIKWQVMVYGVNKQKKWPQNKRYPIIWIECISIFHIVLHRIKCLCLYPYFDGFWYHQQSHYGYGYVAFSTWDTIMISKCWWMTIQKYIFLLHIQCDKTSEATGYKLNFIFRAEVIKCFCMVN